MLISTLPGTSSEFNICKEIHQYQPNMQTIWVERVYIYYKPLPNQFLVRLEQKHQQFQEELEQAAANNNKDDILFHTSLLGVVRSQSSSA
jgi:hypothetical protein